jgi:hypothetical protein
VASRANAFAVVPRGERLDQIGWPIMNDARIAQRAADATGVTWPAPLDAVMRDVRACIERRGGDVADAMRVVTAELTRSPTTVTAELVLCWQLTTAAAAGARGWLAYHAHRRLASDAATAAADVIRGAAALAGRALTTDAVAWALELAARPRVVRVVGPESASAVAREIEEALVAGGAEVEVRTVRVFPTGDAIVRFAYGLLVACDAVVVVVTAGDNSTWIRRELDVQHRLFGDSRPQAMLIDANDAAARRAALDRLLANLA